MEVPRPRKYMVEFLAEWIRDEKLRCKVLKEERKTLPKLGLSPRAVADLLALDTGDILDRIKEELRQDFQMDPEAIMRAINRTPMRIARRGAGFYLWEQGTAHVRRVEPNKIPKARAKTVEVLGQGWDRTLQVWFEPAAGGTRVRGRVLKTWCGTDIWQHANVKVTLPKAGRWLVVAVVPSYSKARQESEERVVLQAR